MVPLEVSLPARPLPEGWSDPERVEDSVIADGVQLFRAGWASTGRGGMCVTGSAAERDPSSSPRARYELLERIATVEALERDESDVETLGPDSSRVGPAPRDAAFPESDRPELWRFARSNGVALHRGWAAACEHARLELAERDRVLRSWYGGTAPIGVEVPEALRVAESYDWRAIVIPPEEDAWSSDVVVAGVLGFPRAADKPLILGYGAAFDRARALAKAEREAFQSLAFLWGEEVPATAPSLAPTAIGHLDWWLYPGHHDRLRRWLAGEHASKGLVRNVADDALPDADVVYVDLTPPWLDPELRVVKALHPSAMPLTFGEAPMSESAPETMRVHPIV